MEQLELGSCVVRWLEQMVKHQSRGCSSVFTLHLEGLCWRSSQPPEGLLHPLAGLTEQAWVVVESVAMQYGRK